MMGYQQRRCRAWGSTPTRDPPTGLSKTWTWGHISRTCHQPRPRITTRYESTTINIHTLHSCQPDRQFQVAAWYDTDLQIRRQYPGDIALVTSMSSIRSYGNKHQRHFYLNLLIQFCYLNNCLGFLRFCNVYKGSFLFLEKFNVCHKVKSLV